MQKHMKAQQSAQCILGELQHRDRTVHIMLYRHLKHCTTCNRLLSCRKHNNEDGILEHRALALRPYLLVPEPGHRKALATLLLADHALTEVRLRYQERRQPPVPCEWRLCRLWGDGIEEPLHALFICSNSPATLVALRASFWDKRGAGATTYHGLAPLETLHRLPLDAKIVNKFARFCYLMLELYDTFPMLVPAADWLRGVLADPTDRRLHSLDIIDPNSGMLVSH